MDFVELQIEHNRKVEEAWSKLLPDLEAIGSTGGVAAASVAGEAPSGANKAAAAAATTESSTAADI